MIIDHEKIIKPFTSMGRTIETTDIKRTINAIANVPKEFETSQLIQSILPPESDATHVERMEALNRLMQRLRRLGLASFKAKRWTLRKNAWGNLQNAVHCTPREKA